MYSGVLDPMSRGYRNVILAAFGWLIFSLSSPCWAADSSKEQRTQQGKTESLGRIANVVEQAAEFRREAAECPKGSDDRKSDLCAQWKAADAAVDSVDKAETANVIGWIGVGLGVVTMVAAIAAAFYAREAALHTKSGAEAAQDSLELSRAQSVQTLRAYVAVENVAFSIALMRGGKEVRIVEVRFKNFGTLPALRFRHSCTVVYTANPGIDPRDFADQIQPEYSGEGAMLAQGQSSIRTTRSFDAEEMLKLVHEEMFLYIACECQYKISVDGEDKVWREFYKLKPEGFESSAEWQISNLKYSFALHGDWALAT